MTFAPGERVEAVKVPSSSLIEVTVEFWVSTIKLSSATDSPLKAKSPAALLIVTGISEEIASDLPPAAAQKLLIVIALLPIVSVDDTVAEPLPVIVS